MTDAAVVLERTVSNRMSVCPSEPRTPAEEQVSVLQVDSPLSVYECMWVSAWARALFTSLTAIHLPFKYSKRYLNLPHFNFLHDLYDFHPI